VICRNLIAAQRRFCFQQFQLQVAQLLAARTKAGDPFQAKLLFQYLNLQLRVIEFLLLQRNCFSNCAITSAMKRSECREKGGSECVLTKLPE